MSDDEERMELLRRHIEICEASLVAWERMAAALERLSSCVTPAPTPEPPR